MENILTGLLAVVLIFAVCFGVGVVSTLLANTFFKEGVSAKDIINMTFENPCESAKAGFSVIILLSFFFGALYLIGLLINLI